MFFRTKNVKGYQYIQIVENHREGSSTKQQVIATLGRLDVLRQSGHLDALIKSGARFTEKLMVIQEHKEDEGFATKRIGPSLIFTKLWEKIRCTDIIKVLVSGGATFERAIFLTILHSLFDPGSDLTAEKWKENYQIDGTANITLYHLYKAMMWLGTASPKTQQTESSDSSLQYTKDDIEKWLYNIRQGLSTKLCFLYLYPTTLYSQEKGSEALGRQDHNNDDCPRLNQIVIGVVIDGKGRPICTEIWPGNTVDVVSLIPAVNRIKSRFGIKDICIVVDRDMISKKTIQSTESKELRLFCILGAKVHEQNELNSEVLSRAGRYKKVRYGEIKKNAPSPLKVKEVWIDNHRYIVCLSESQTGNKACQKHPKSEGRHNINDYEKIQELSRYDGKWVFYTNTALDASEIALKYKQLWVIEDLLRPIKSILETRPIFHQRDESIRGLVFCSFLAMLMRKELQDRLDSKGFHCEWEDVINDVNLLEEMEISQDDKCLILRSEVKGCCEKVFQAVDVALPPTVRRIEKDNGRRKALKNQSLTDWDLTF